MMRLQRTSGGAQVVYLSGGGIVTYYGANVYGGGITGQSDAIALGIARYLTDLNPSYRDNLKKKGLLSRDPREKERKKYGQKRARKKFQFSKS